MGKKLIKIFGFLILILCSCFTFFSVEQNQTSSVLADNLYVNKLKNSEEVIISNTKLRNAICNLLGKTYDSKLYSDDFLNHEDYKVNKIIDENTGIEKISAKKTYLDLSNSGINNITELCQFEFPETLVAIDLSNNQISNNDLIDIANFLTLNKSQKNIIFNDNELPINTDFDTQILKINLSFNNLDLNTVDLNNTKLIFGIQNFNSDNYISIYDDIKNAKYYIRESDSFYLAFNFKYNYNTLTYKYNTISNLINSTSYGEYEFEIASPMASETSYFNGLSHKKNCVYVSANIKNDFIIERTSIFNLQPTDIEIIGLLGDYSIKIFNASTSQAGINYCAIQLTYNNSTKNLSLPFVVVDTTKPTINLLGYSTMYWQQFKSFVDPGYEGWDSNDNLTNFVDVDYSNLDVTQVGTYYITYNLKDASNNVAETVIRTVIVQEQVLDTITIRSNTTNFVIGQEILLTVQPNENISIENYSNLVYNWYINGQFFKSTNGDKITGKSSISLIFDTNEKREISVKLQAKQTVDGIDIVVNSEKFIIEPNFAIDPNTTIIIACVVAILLIITTIIIITYTKSKKAKRKITKKVTNTKSNNDSIQIIRDYNPNTNTKDNDKKS